MYRYRKSKGFTLLEVIVAMAIFLSTSALFTSIVSGNYKLIKAQDIKADYNKVIIMVQNELKYNIDSCEIYNYFKDQTYMYLELNNLLHKVIDEDFMDIVTSDNESEDSIRMSINGMSDNEIILNLEIIEGENEVVFCESFKKKIWMENM